MKLCFWISSCRIAKISVMIDSDFFLTRNSTAREFFKLLWACLRDQTNSAQKVCLYSYILEHLFCAYLAYKFLKVNEKCKHTFVRQTSFCQQATEAQRKISNVFKNTLYNLHLKMRILIYKLLFFPPLVGRYRGFIHIGKQFLYRYAMQSKCNALDTKYFINRKKWKYETSRNRTDIMKNVEQLLCIKKKMAEHWNHIYTILYIYITRVNT